MTIPTHYNGKPVFYFLLVVATNTVESRIAFRAPLSVAEQMWSELYSKQDISVGLYLVDDIADAEKRWKLAKKVLPDGPDATTPSWMPGEHIRIQRREQAKEEDIMNKKIYDEIEPLPPDIWPVVGNGMDNVDEAERRTTRELYVIGTRTDRAHAISIFEVTGAEADDIATRLLKADVKPKQIFIGTLRRYGSWLQWLRDTSLDRRHSSPWFYPGAPGWVIVEPGVYWRLERSSKGRQHDRA